MSPGTEAQPILYRFRPLKRVLDDGELENQEIYLSSPEDLNDPMEGFKDVVWQGDAYLWRNLMRHYIICLAWSFAGTQVGDESHVVSSGISARFTDENLPTDEMRALCNEAFATFLETTSMELLFQVLGRNRVPLRRQALHGILATVHLPACETISRTFEKHGLKKPSPWRIPRNVASAIRRTWEMLAKMAGDEMDPDLVNALFAASGKTKLQMDLLYMYNKWAEGAVLDEMPGRFLLFDFPSRYLDGTVDELLHPRWYTVCFSARCDNASMWSTYAGGHTGVALKFRAADSDDGRTIPLCAVLGTSTTPTGSQDVGGPVRARLYEVRYADAPITWDFFSQLGQLTRQDLRFWHRGEDGQISPSAAEADFGGESWRARYWDRCRASVTVKLQDWAHEDEQRLVLWDLLGTLDRHRKARYDFDSLCGIVFGMRTPTEAKLRIMRILQAKCAESKRDDFELFQADYSPKSHRIELRPLSLVHYRS